MNARQGPAGVPDVVRKLNAHINAYKQTYIHALRKVFGTKGQLVEIHISAAQFRNLRQPRHTSSILYVYSVHYAVFAHT